MNQLLLGIYAIYDLKAERYDTPFFAVSDLFASRRFQLMAAEKNSPLVKWKEDFELHRLSNIDISTGEVVVQGIETILKAKEIK